jgi:hypothetical protein
MAEFEKVICPKCSRTISHYIKGSGTDSVYRNVCPRCGETVIIYSAGKTALAEPSILLKIEIKF